MGNLVSTSKFLYCGVFQKDLPRNQSLSHSTQAKKSFWGRAGQFHFGWWCKSYFKCQQLPGHIYSIFPVLWIPLKWSLDSFTPQLSKWVNAVPHYVCVCIYVCVHVWACVWRLEVSAGVFGDHRSVETRPLLTAGAHWLGTLDAPVLSSYRHCCYSRHVWVFGIQMRPSDLRSSHLTSWVFSPQLPCVFSI